MTASCRWHCRGCGAHFSSIKAFDTHRVGEFDRPRGESGGRACRAPDPADGFVRQEGICAVDDHQEAAVWTLAASLEWARRAFHPNLP